MATIEPYQTSTGAKRYMVRYRTPQQTQTKKRGFKTKRDAQEFAATVEVEKMTGTYVAPVSGSSVGGWPRRGCPARNLRGPVELPDPRSAWRIDVKPVWGTARVADIDLAAVERWIAAMGRTSGATTVIRAYGVLAASSMTR